MRLQEGESVIHELRPDLKVLGIWSFTKCILAALGGAFFTFWVFGFFGTIFAAATDSNRPLVVGVITALVAVPALLIITLVYSKYLRHTYVYYITNRRCVFHGGILRRVERSVPYHKITDVEMSQTIVERALGISTLKIFTPGTGSMYPAFPFGGQRAEISFVGLTDNETPATTINEILKQFKATGE